MPFPAKIERVPHLTAAQAEQVKAMVALCEEAQRAVRELDALWDTCRVPGLSSTHIAGAECSLNHFYVAAVTRLTE